jgi:hypothetical protein
MPAAPWAWAAVCRPQRPASSRAAAISASEYCCEVGGMPFESTAPVTRIFTKSAPFLRFVRTARVTSAGPSARLRTIGTST